MHIKLKSDARWGSARTEFGVAGSEHDVTLEQGHRLVAAGLATTEEKYEAPKVASKAEVRAALTKAQADKTESAEWRAKVKALLDNKAAASVLLADELAAYKLRHPDLTEAEVEAAKAEAKEDAAEAKSASKRA